MRLLLCVLLALTLSAGTTRTARGTINSTNNSNSSTLSVTVGTTGSSIIVIAGNGANRTVSTIALTGCTFSAADKAANDGTRDIEIWSAHNCTAGTNTMTVTWSGNANPRTFDVTELNGANGALVTGTSASGTGSSGTATTTTSITCTPNASADCAWIAGTRVNGGPAVTFVNPDNTGQDTGANFEGYEIDSAAVTQAGNATFTSAAWVMAMVNYLEPAAPSASTLFPRALMGVGK